MIEQETLKLLEWHLLCQHLSTFAATKLGKGAAVNLDIPSSPQGSYKLLRQTEEVFSLITDSSCNWSFDGIYDIGVSLERAKMGGTLGGKELLQIASTLGGFRRLKKTIDQRENLVTLGELVAGIGTFAELEQEIYFCIDERGEVAERASPKLAGIRQKIRSLRHQIQETLQSIIQSFPYALQEAVITQRGERFVLPVKADHSNIITGIVHDTSSSGLTLYVEPKEIIPMGNQLQTARLEEKREEERILAALSAKVGKNWEALEKLLAVVTILDLATARARYGLWLDAYPPEFIDFAGGESISLKSLRHPLLIWQEKHENGRAVVPIDVQISPNIRVVAITGPNTGGKTVTLKTVGLVCLMAKAGMYIPAKPPVRLPWFDKVLADIGDEQSLQQNLSTFSGHICRIVRILEAIEGANCLVLLDEIGAGTDPQEGAAIAIAILKYLADHNLLTIATTHYGELKSLKYSDSRFENASVEFDDVSLQPTYRLLWGVPGRSNAIVIARRLGLKPEILHQAETLVGNLSLDVNELISALENQRRQQEEKHRQAEELLQKTESFYREVSAKAKALQERERDLKRELEREIREQLLAAKSQISQVIKELKRKSEPTTRDAQKATESLNKIGQRFLTPLQEEKLNTGYRPKVGEKVKIISIGQVAEVLEVNEDNQQVTARFGIMRMIVPFSDIESLAGEKAVAAPKTNTTPSPSKSVSQSSPPPPIPIRTPRNTVDIRGKRVHLAYPILEKAIASASEMGTLWIVHGKGTGALRRGVHEFLANHPQVSHYTDAPENEGGTGVTIAYLK
ncbi:MAG: endonuclease MutS2 [Geminocystis sp.]|nr:endonuclease MutS2 [Geminocystis sp.]HIK37019.1 endonuclease MutS2 [Geminocystis sp. M7585_C2015_104]